MEVNMYYTYGSAHFEPDINCVMDPQDILSLCTDLFSFQPLSIFETIFENAWVGIYQKFFLGLGHSVSLRCLKLQCEPFRGHCFLFFSDRGLSNLLRDWAQILSARALLYNIFNLFFILALCQI